MNAIANSAGGKPVYEYRVGAALDPQQMAMYAEVYGWEMKWPDKQVQEHGNPLMAFVYAVGVLAWFGPAVWWLLPRYRRAWCLCMAAAGLLLVSVGRAEFGAVVLYFNAGTGALQATVNNGQGSFYCRARKVEDMPDGPIAHDWAAGIDVGTGNGVDLGTVIIPSGESWQVTWVSSNIPFGTAGPYAGGTCKAVFPATTNTTAYEIQYRLVHSIDGVVSTVVLPPGDSAPRTEHTVTCGGTYRIEYQSPDGDAAAGLATDGVWITVEGTEVDPDGWDWGEEIGDVPSTDVNPPEPPVPPAVGPDGNPLPPGAPGEPGTPWGEPTAATPDADRLDKATYKQGVAKILSQLQVQTKALTETTVTVPPGAKDPATQSAGWDPGTKDLAAMVEGKLPVAPTIVTTMSTVSAFTINLDIPKLGGGTITFNKTIDFGAAPYATPVAVFRGICLVLLTLSFFLLVFWTVRGAFTTTK